MQKNKSFILLPDILVINIALFCSVPALIVNSEQNLIFIAESSHSTYCSSYFDIAFICLEVVTIHVCYHGQVRFAIVFTPCVYNIAMNSLAALSGVHLKTRKTLCEHIS